ncbi:MAG: hypothetical protein K0Q78_1440, partial [Cellvibrio sp.]|nr:hypothetical protein [Cellvibrio sp.]
EDGVISTVENGNPLITFTYVEPEKKSALGHQTANLIDQGKALVDANNCLGCHKLDEKIVGPAFRDVAKKYQKDPAALVYLVNKIGNGGAGVWGEMNMPGFSGLSEAERTALATYVLSLAVDHSPKGLALSGKVDLESHQKNSPTGSNKPYAINGEAYIFIAKYTDKGAHNLAPITATEQIRLIPPRLDFDSVFSAASATKEATQDTYNEVKTIKILGSEAVSGFGIGRYDLTSVKSVKVGALFFKETTKWLVEIRRDNAEGEVLGSGTISPSRLKTYDRSSIALKSTSGFSELYISVKPEQKTTAEVRLQDISFEK